ncbi:polyprenyl synthetase family protein [Fervidibacillus albus]|uniref:Polyprenyl synthetase family protein n=1 Tax=Fervidibacillus albus TaxID=2980026 RepID=A0A9E8RVV0_9BACI|nr:polyprenyl synthetase family protein [Fervidibacillus albus]WAA09348.1 polyprenyl synthetase family protein [Fervidibacillus albus]
MLIHSMWDSYPWLKKELAEVLQMIDQNVRIRDKTIEQIIKETIFSGGKLLRPAYSLLCSNIGPQRDCKRAIAIAAALECLHTATLIHDDVIDEADIRHGISTLHTTSGNKFAIYAGDYLFSLSFTLLSKYASTKTNVKIRLNRVDKILTGELEQLHSRYRLPTSVKDYLSRISGKTAQLFAVSCYSGAVESGASTRIAAHAWNMGHYIGMAFQIMDDVLDFISDEKTVGKPIMNDVRQGIYTLPIIYSMERKGDHLKQILAKKNRLTNQDLEEILKIIHFNRGIEKSEELAKKYTEKALQELRKLPEGAYKKDLYSITKKLLERKM